jgi:serine/threonine protein kinase
MEATDFWKLLSASQLLPPAVLQQQYGLTADCRNATQVARFLVSKKLLTDWQANILLADRSGPFHFGNYTLFGQYKEQHKGQGEQGGLAGDFKARHRPTQHPVVLEFLPGQSPEDLIRWQRMEELVELLANMNSRHLVNVFESVVMPDYRFVVFEKPEGVVLTSLLKGSSRMQWKQACALFAQVAAGLDELHGQGLHHRRCWPAEIWLAKTGRCQLKIDLHSVAIADPNSDWSFSAGSQAASKEAEFVRHYQLPAGRPPEMNRGSSATDDLPDKADQDGSAGVQEDLFSLIAALGRVLKGQDLIDNQLSSAEQDKLLNQRLQELEERKIPESVIEILRRGLASDPLQKKSRFQTARELAEELAAIAEVQPADFAGQPPATLNAYRKALMPLNRGAQVDSFPELAGIAGTRSASEEFAKENAVNVSTDRLADPNSLPSGDRSAAVQQIARRKKSKRQQGFLSLVSSLLAFLLLLGAAGYYAATFQGPVASSDSAGATGISAGGQAPQNADAQDVRIVAEPELSAGGERLAELPNLPEVDRPTIWQKLIKDDRVSLWQSPTEGAPLVVDRFPPNPRILIDLRPAALLELEEGKRLLASVGPALMSVIRNWENRSGLTLPELSRLTVAFHQTDSEDYQPFMICQLSQKRSIEQLLAGWGQPQVVPGGADQRFFMATDQQWAYWMGPDQGEYEWFAMGAPELISAVAADPQGARVTGGMRQLINQSDRDRHFQLLFLRPALFNDQGMRWMGTGLQDLNRQLAVLIPDALQAGMISLHLDAGTYLEFQAVGSVEAKPRELQEQLVQRLREQRDLTIDLLAKIPGYPHWDRVRNRFNLMLVDLFRNLRWGIEYGEVVANAWLPPMAAHNLISAAELAVYFSAGGSAVNPAVAGGSATPQTWEQLLEMKRDLNVANPPDLNLLLTDLQNEIRDEFPDLPFSFRIRLMGSDLQLAGITQNQRPGELRIQQKTLGNILTDIMTSANPAKDISGPEDPRCQLVWVIADDPEQPGEKSVLITTRNAAAEKGYALPPAFQKREP